MKLKSIAAVAAAFSLCTVSFASIAAAASVDIAYTATDAGLGCGDDGYCARRNIYNVWGNSVEEIDPEVAVYGNITVTFTVSGIGTDSSKEQSSETRYDADGGAYVAYVCGSIAGNSRNNAAEVGDEYVYINGDGTYTAVWTLTDSNGEVFGSENISCLYLQTNIDYLIYGSDEEKEKDKKERDIADSGVMITINSITTEEAPEEDTSDSTEDTSDSTEDTSDTSGGTDTNSNDTGSSTTTTTTSGSSGNSTTTTTTTSNSSGSSSTTTAASTSSSSSSAVTTESNTDTGDAGIMAAVAVLAAAGIGAFASKKRK